MGSTATESRPIGAGRPRLMASEERRRVLIAAAAELFLSKGYHATTMDDVAKSVRMSKKTVYQVFSGKSDLFDALLTDWFAPYIVPVDTDNGEPREILTKILLRMAKFTLEEQQIALMRLLISETSYSEDIAAALQRQGLGKGKGVLEQWLATQKALGVLKVDNPDEVSSMLFFAATGDCLFDLLLRVRDRPSDTDLQARIERVVDLFFLQMSCPGRVALDAL